MNCEVDASCPPTYSSPDPDQLLSSCAGETEPQETWEQWLDGWVKKLDGMVAFLNPSRHESRCDEAYENVANLAAMLGIAGTVLSKGGGGTGRGPAAGRRKRANVTDSTTPRTPTTPAPGAGADGTKRLSAEQTKALQNAGFTQKELAILEYPGSIREAAKNHNVNPNVVFRLTQRGDRTLKSAGLPRKKTGEPRDLEQERWDIVRTFGKTPQDQREEFLRTHGVTEAQVTKWAEVFRLEASGPSPNPTRIRAGGRNNALSEEQQQAVRARFQEAIDRGEPPWEARARIAAEHGVHPHTIKSAIEGPRQRDAARREPKEPEAPSTWAVPWKDILAERQKHRAELEKYYTKTGIEPPKAWNPE